MEKKKFLDGSLINETFLRKGWADQHQINEQKQAEKC